MVSKTDNKSTAAAAPLKKDNNKKQNNYNNDKKSNNKFNKGGKSQQQQQPPTKSEKSMNTFSNKFFKNDKKDKKDNSITTTTNNKQSNNNKQPNNKSPKDIKSTKDTKSTKESNKPSKDNSTTPSINKKVESKPTKDEDSEEIKIEKPNNEAKNPMFTKAQGLYNKKVEEYIQDFNKNGNRDDQWKDKIQHTGTIRDRISAITLLVQKAPMFRLSSLDILLNLAAKKSERERDFAVNSLKDLFVNSLLPNTKLKRFNERTNIENAKPMELVQWFFEDLLKSRYQAFIRLLEVLSRDTVSRIRMIASATIQYLLLKKPEQEEVLLTLLVNKLGDDEGSNASKVVKLLEKLVEAHPSMKLVVIREVELFLYRPNNASKAQYNALFFLNKIQVVSESDGTSNSEICEISHRLITLYFTFFSNKSNINSSAISLLIFGIRKAYSYTKNTTKIDDTQIKSLFKSCRKNTINKVIQTLSLLFEIKQHTPEITNQFYLNLYHTLNRFEKLSQFDQTSFLNLIFRAIKHDDNINRAKAIIKRLVQFSFNQIVSFSASTLILLAELIKFNSEFASLITVNPQTPIKVNEEGEPIQDQDIKSYDSQHFEPSDANAQLSCLWELNLYSIHQHPTISQFARDLLKEKEIKFQGNPTTLFTLSAFLEKFALSRPKNRKGPQSTLNVTKSKIGQDYYNAKPDEQFLNTYGDISSTSGVTSTKKKSSGSDQFIVDDKELDEVLGYKSDERDSDEEVFSDLDAEYSYSDLEDEDFEEEDIESEIPMASAKKSTKKLTQQQDGDEDDDEEEDFNIDEEEFNNLTKDNLLGEIPSDLDELDVEEDEDEEDEEIEDEDGEEGEEDVDLDDEEDVQIPDFGEEDEEEVEDEDGTIAPDFGEDGEEDEEGDDKEESAFIKSMKNNDAFMDADEFASMLENSGNGGIKNNKSKNNKSNKSNKSAPVKSNKSNNNKKSNNNNKNNKRKRF